MIFFLAIIITTRQICARTNNSCSNEFVPATSTATTTTIAISQ
jgi:hypothetical protein